MNEVVLPVYCREFKSSMKTKFVKHSVPSGFGFVIDEFKKEAEILDTKAKFDEIVQDELGKVRKGKMMIDEAEGIDFKLMMNKWWTSFLLRLDEILELRVSDAIMDSSVKRCKIDGIVFNFSTIEVDEDLKRMLNLGGNFVVHNEIMNESAARSKFENELFIYAKRYRACIEQKREINEYYFVDWIKEAVKDSVGLHAKFYSDLLEMKQIGLSRRRFGFCNNHDFTKLDQQNIVVVECDKNCGIAIMDVERMKFEDKKMIKELGGVKWDNYEEEDIKVHLDSVIKKFEEDLDDDAKKFLNIYYPERKYLVEDSVLPFLKLKAKIHKLSEEQLKARNVEALKFRPVIDSSRTAFQQYSDAIMNFSSELTRRLVDKFFNGKSPLAKNGQQVAKLLQSMNKENTSGTYFAISDLSSAYSYIYLENLQYSVKFAAREVGIPDWKTTMYNRMIEMVLGNSFVQTSVGIYKLSMSSCLPMGLGMSGEALDLVCMTAEVNLFGKVIAPEFSRCSELEPFWEISDEAKLMESVKKYLRYRDDTFTYGSLSEEGNLRRTVNALGSAFLTTLDLNVNLSHFVGSFLDCFFYKKLTGEGFVTFVRRKGNFPVTFQHADSNSGDSVVRSIISGEVLRHRRLCSTEGLANVNDDCLRKELESRGYLN